MYLSREIWVVKKYNLHITVHVSNSKCCSQNLDEEFGFFSLTLSEINMRKIGPLIIFILIEYSMLLEDLQLKEIEFFKRYRSKDLF